MKNKLVIALLAAAAPLAAHAEGYYAGAGLGYAEQKINIDKFGDFKEGDVAYKVFTGHNFDKNFGIEAGYTDFGTAEYANKSVGSKARSFYAAGTATLPLGDKFALTAKLGIAKNRAKVVRPGEGDVKDKKTDALIGIGGTLKLTPTITAFIEYENYGNVMQPAKIASIKATVLSTGLRFSF
ncbi:outer membrane beta-barrel protein [Massilia mucilaginosa]|uniref:outer membrane beta-barrel protein n=1 Tax=Massilia mucilaginosa TaxID=2609282 RepID=UPI00141D8807